MATTAAAPAPPTMNGFGINPPTAPSSSNPIPPPAAPTAAMVPATASTPATLITSSNPPTNQQPPSNRPAIGAAVAPSPFSSTVTPVKQYPPANSRPGPLPSTINGTTVTTTSIPFPYPSHDTTSITGKRKRADSSPVKEPQAISGVPFAQKQKLLSDFRKGLLSALIELDAGISLLDNPVSSEPNPHEIKKSKTLSAPDGLQTLRQRLSSDLFYPSLQPLLKDVNSVANEALETHGATPGIAPEDEMKDDDPTPIKNEAGDAVGLIRKFRQAAQDMISNAVIQYPYLNISDEPPKIADDDDDDDDDDSNDQNRNFKTAISFNAGGKKLYAIVKPPKEPAAPKPKPNSDEMEIDGGPDEGYVSSQDVHPRASFIKIYESDTALSKPQTMKNLFPRTAKAVQTIGDGKEKDTKKTRENSLQTAEWQDNGPFSSFLPTSDEKDSIVTASQKSWLWYSVWGEQELKRVRAGPPKELPDEEKAFKELADAWEPMPIDPALFEGESENDKALREISDILSELNLKQHARLTKQAKSSQLTKPDQAETSVYEKVRDRLVQLIAKLDPEVCDKLDEILDADSSSNSVLLRGFAMPGSMPNPEKAPPPQAPVPTPAPQFTTTRVSYAPYAGDGSFTPTARVVSSRSSGHNQYTNRASYSQPHYAQPQTPVRQQYPPNSPYYPPQTPYTGQHRQAIPSTPQFPPAGYVNSPFRSSAATVPRIAAGSSQQVYVQGSATPTYQAPAIRQTSFITQQTSHGGPQTGRRVSLAPQIPPQTQQQHRPPSTPGFSAPFTQGHTQYTGIAQQTQQQMLRTQQQQQQQQFHAQPHTPNQAQYAMYHQQSPQVRAIQPGQPRAPYPNGYQGQVRIVQGPPSTPGQPTNR
ncbi:hypothetical protein TWF694_002543 [Orbilia ellipsospora]|uniref:Uncharacterized protein n=1 Tax=Orbilia ellipsospora TaxID=2528407 RepID=A0AAV9X2B4_9PEZI